jgi:hypothetical protein
VSVSWRTWHFFLLLFPKSQRDEVFDELIFPPFSLEILEDIGIWDLSFACTVLV